MSFWKRLKNSLFESDEKNQIKSSNCNDSDPPVPPANQPTTAEPELPLGRLVEVARRLERDPSFATEVEPEAVLADVEWLVGRGREGEALIQLRRLATALPDQLPLRLRLAQLLADRGDRHEARDLLETLCRASDCPEQARLLLADLLLRIEGGDRGKAAALEQFEAVLALRFDHPSARSRADELRRQLWQGPSSSAATVLGPQADSARYQLVRELGRGGGGTVYLANDPETGRDVAVKLLHVGTTPDARGRLFAEARISASLQHPGIITIFDLDERLNLVVMEYCAGGTLAGQPPLPPVAALDRLIQVAGIIDHVHRAGVVHRDIKPSNLLLRGPEPDRVPVLTDFGIAHLLDSGERKAPPDLVVRPRGGQLENPELVHGGGSLLYTAPEQRAGHPATPEADLYSLGVVLLELLLGRPPLSNREAIRGARLLDAAPLWSEMADLAPPPLCDLARHLVQPEAKDRPKTAAILRRRCQEISNNTK